MTENGQCRFSIDEGVSVTESVQMSLPVLDSTTENRPYLTEQLITYIGNKRSLLKQIEGAIQKVRMDIGGEKIRFLDAFSGSGVVSRLAKSHSRFLVANDLEDYSAAINRCYLANRSSINRSYLHEIVKELNAKAMDPKMGYGGFVQRLYAPQNDDHILPGERVFYTSDNARRLDFYGECLQSMDAAEKDLLTGPFLSAASVHANTAGVFKGFYKDRNTGSGRFGGSGADALHRIKGRIVLKEPVLSSFECDTLAVQMDANELQALGQSYDLVYLDPPYNQHPYGSNYFMLNLLLHYREPSNISEVSGIPDDWRRSDYNVRSKAFHKFAELIQAIDTRYFLISFNDEGFISPEDMRRLLASVGEVQELKISYNAFRGSRNLRDRKIHVTEHLFLVKVRNGLWQSGTNFDN